VTSTLIIDNLRVEVGEKEVLKGFSLTMRSGEVHAIMGPNGSGKSTLAHALTGHPGYKVLDGSVTIDGVELLTLSATERARAGLMLVLQQPFEIPGVRAFDLLEAAGANPSTLRARMLEEAHRLELRPELLDRFVNVDLSGANANARRWCNWESSNPSLRCSMRLTQVLTSTRWTRWPDDWWRRRPSGTAACWRSRTFAAFSWSYRRP